MVERTFSEWMPSAAVDFIRDFEGCSLVAYLCPAGIWTVGYGHTGPEVHEGLTITDKTSEEWLLADILKVRRELAPFVNRPVTEGQFVALISLAFNVGAYYVTHKCPRLMRALNTCDDDEAARQFLDITKANGIELPGLVRRRQAEARLFLSEV